MKKRVTVSIYEQTLEAAKNAVAALCGSPDYLTLSGLVERAVDNELVDLCAGAGVEDFPTRTAPLRRGPVQGRSMERPETGVYGCYGAAKFLGVSTSTIRKLVRTGVLPHTRVGRLLKFSHTDLESWQLEHTTCDYRPMRSMQRRSR